MGYGVWVWVWGEGESVHVKECTWEGCEGVMIKRVQRFIRGMRRSRVV